MADETSRLVIAVDSTSAKAANADLDKLTAASERAEAAASALTKATQEYSAASTEAAASATAQADAVNAFAETQADVDARLKAVARSYREELEASEASTKAAYDSATSASSVAAAQSTQSASTAKLVSAQNAQMAASSRAVEMQTQYERVMAISAGTTAELDAAEAQLNKLRAAGAITTTEYAAAVDRLAKAKLLDAAASKVDAAAQKAPINSRAASEIATGLSEVAAGNFGRLRRTGAAFANQSGLLAKIMTPTGAAITAGVVALGAYTVALLKADEQTQDFNKALLATGTYIEGGGKALSGTAAQVGVLTGQYSAATQAVMALTKEGLGGASNLQQLSAAITNVATITGLSVDKISQSFIALQKDPLDAIGKTTEFMGLLTTAQYKEIAALQDTQGPAAAAALAIKDIGEQAEAATKKLDDSAGAVLQFLDSAKSFGSRALFLIGHVGSNDIGTQIAVLQAQRKNLEDTLSSSAANWVPGYTAVIKKSIAEVDTQITDLQKKQAVSTFYDAGQSAAASAKLTLEKSYNDLAKNELQTAGDLQAKYKAINDERRQALALATTQDQRDRINANADKRIVTATKDYNKQFPASASTHASARTSAADPLASMQSMVNSLSESAQRAEGPVGQFLATVQKLTTARDAAIKKGADAGQAEKLFAEGIGIANQRLKEQETQLQQRNKVAMEQFTAALQQQMAVQKQQNDLAIASVGLGSQQAQREQQVLQIRVQTQQKLFELQQRAQQSIAQINPQAPGAQSQIDQINQTLAQQQAAYKAFGDWQIAEQQRVYAGQDAAVQDWSNGLTRTYADLLVKSKDFATAASQELTDFANGVGDAFVNIVQGGESVKKAFGSVIDTMLADALRFVANQAVTKFLGLFMNNGQGGGFGSSGSAFGASQSSGGTDWGNLVGDVVSWFGGGRANGGPVSPYTAYQVNERGTPELLSVGSKTFLMMGAQGGTVTPTASGGRKGGTTNISVNVQPTTSRRTANQVALAVSREQQLAVARS